MRLLKKLFLLAVFSVCLLAIAMLAVYAYLYKTIGKDPNRPDVEYVLRDPKIMSKIVFADGSPICEVGSERRVVVSLKEISPLFIRAILATEDREFYKHDGVNHGAIGRAILNNLRKGKMQGASTITQQVVKNLLLTPEKNWKRKAREYFLAKELEEHLTNKLGSKKAAKDKILEIYLNWIVFGVGRYGVESASQYFFGHAAREMNWAEAFSLAAIPKNPEKYNPRRPPGKKDPPGMNANAVRRKLLAASAFKNRRISAAEYESALKTQLVLSKSTISAGGIAQWICDSGKRRLETQFCKGIEVRTPRGRQSCDQKMSSLGIVVQTPIRKDLQAAMMRFAAQARNAVAARHPQLNKIDGANPVSIVALAIENSAGYVIGDAVIPYNPGSLNLAFAPQQPGSTMKPLVYATGFDMGILTPDTTYVDEESHLDARHPDKIWPLNYEPEHLGAISVRHALAESVNTVAVLAIIDIGAQNVINKSKELGIVSPLANERSLALGASAISPLEIAGAYSTFARGGRYIQLLMFTRIGKDAIIPASRQALSPSANNMVLIVTNAVIEEGTGRRVKGHLPVISYGKTGTTSGHTDAWFVLFTKDYTVVVWVGHQKRQTLGAKETGATAALPPALDIMHWLYKGEAAGAVYAMSTAPIDDSKTVEHETEIEELGEGDVSIVEEPSLETEIPEQEIKETPAIPAKGASGRKPDKGTQEFDEFIPYDPSMEAQVDQSE